MNSISLSYQNTQSVLSHRQSNKKPYFNCLKTHNNQLEQAVVSEHINNNVINEKSNTEQDIVFPQRLSTSISNIAERHANDAKSRKLNEIKHDTFKSNLNGYSFNLKESLDVDHDIRKHRLNIRDEPSSQTKSPQLDNTIIYNRFNNISNLIDKVPLVSNTTLVLCITYLDKADLNNRNSKPDLVPKRKESQYTTIEKNNYLLTKDKDKQDIRRKVSQNFIEGTLKSQAMKIMDERITKNESSNIEQDIYYFQGSSKLICNNRGEE